MAPAVVLIPEIPFDIDEVCDRIRRRHERGRYASIVVVAEGAEPVAGTLDVGEQVYDQFGHVRLGGIGDVIAREIGERTGFETRVVLLGHVQRGGTPTAFDRVLSTRFGVAAIDAVHDRAWGQMVVAPRHRDRAAPRSSVAVGKTRPVDLALYHDVAEIFFALSCSAQATRVEPVQSARARASAAAGRHRGGYGGCARTRREARVVVDRERPACCDSPLPVGPLRPAVDAEAHGSHAVELGWPVNTICATANAQRRAGQLGDLAERSTGGCRRRARPSSSVEVGGERRAQPGVELVRVRARRAAS